MWVGGNLFLYYEKGKPEKSRGSRRAARPWRGQEEPGHLSALGGDGSVPDLRDHLPQDPQEDTRTKKDLYERLGVAELVLFDPYGEYLKPRLQGYRLERGRYRPILPNRDGSLHLRTAGVTARPEGERLRLVDTATGEKLLWNDELEAARQAAEERAAAAEERAAAAEERARALAEELARLRR